MMQISENMAWMLAMFILLSAAVAIAGIRVADHLLEHLPPQVPHFRKGARLMREGFYLVLVLSGLSILILVKALP